MRFIRGSRELRSFRTKLDNSSIGVRPNVDSASVRAKAFEDSLLNQHRQLIQDEIGLYSIA